MAVGRRGHVAQLARHFHVGGVLGEAHGHIVGLQAHGGLDVLHVLGRQRGRRQTTALLVDALVIGQLAAQAHGGLHLLAMHEVDDQLDQAIVEQQHVAGPDIARQFLVVQPHAIHVAGLGARGVENKARAGLQHDLALGELAHADLGALQVGHDGDLAARALGGFAHQRRTLDVVLRRAVAEVQPHHVDTFAHHLLQDLRAAGSGAQGGDDLGGAAYLHGVSLGLGRWSAPLVATR